MNFLKHFHSDASNKAYEYFREEALLIEIKILPPGASTFSGRDVTLPFRKLYTHSVVERDSDEIAVLEKTAEVEYMRGNDEREKNVREDLYERISA